MVSNTNETTINSVNIIVSLLTSIQFSLFFFLSSQWLI
jgi:hypothetical protein